MNAQVEDSKLTALVEQPQVAQLPLRTPMDILLEAIQTNTDLARLEKFMDLAERWRAAQSKQAYVAAFAQFKRNMPDIVKDMLNKQYGSDYSSLANLVNTTNKALGEHGLNARWNIKQGEAIKVVCILTHEQGHSEEVEITGPPDTSGQKNPLQQIKSTLTYLEGATFQAITGVVARSACADDDGNGAGAGPKLPPAPDGYEKWADDLLAVVDEGAGRLKEVWKASLMPLRVYMTKHEPARWEAMKRKAEQVSTPGTAA